MLPARRCSSTEAVLAEDRPILPNMRTWAVRHRSMSWSRVIFVLLYVASPVVADVEVFPTFSEPVVAGESVLIASPDSKRLVCIDGAGHVRWTKVIRKLVSFGLLDEDHFYAQDGRRVSRLTIEKGARSPIITLPAGESVTIDSESAI